MRQGKFTFRGLTEADKQQVTQWLQADEHHQSANPALFTDTVAGRAPFVLEHNGTPLFYVSIENVARVHIQFQPGANTLSNAKALIAGFKWLCNNLANRGYWEVIFDSKFAPLIRFCQSVLGFTKCSEDYSTKLGQ